jgi:hypothetical protein
MSKNNSFLAQESHGYLIAKIATLFQGALTTILSILLALSIADYSWTTYLISIFLTLDVLFVVSHLAYRICYTGPRMPLSKNTKYILILHSVFSTIALGMTQYYVLNIDDISHYFAVTAIVMWFISLVFGDMFFRRKYSEALGGKK